MLMVQDGGEFHEHAKKEEQGQNPDILIAQAWSIKDLLIKIKKHFLLRVLAI